ncbi:MAG: hypothetical protein Q9168_007611 [Polycauliona sp. 1 TL-2023]
MEVFVRNIQQEATEKQVKQFFRPILAELDINVFNCSKPRNQGYAKITIPDRQLGQRFLNNHGQVVPGHRGFKTVKKGLFHMNRPLNCSLSTTPADEYILRSLSQEQAGKDLAARRPNTKAPRVADKHSRRVFNFNVIYCGAMDYIGDELTFAPCYAKVSTGRLAFGRRFVRVDFDPSDASTPAKQMEIPYSSIRSLMMGRSTSSLMTFSLTEAPKIYEQIQDGNDLIDRVNQLGLNRLRKKQNVPERRRTMAIDPSHGAIVASCLCYRFHVGSADIPSILALKRLPGYPDVVSWDVRMLQRVAFQTQMTEFNAKLNGTEWRAYPFELKFQLQRLAQNGYLPPYKVLLLMRKIRKSFVDADNSSLADAIRKLFSQIPYPGAETEASELSVNTLQELLMNNYKKVLREKEYAKDLTTQYEQIAMIYKAMVTPAGVYLSGPEPEIKNRVLRTYSDFTSYFLQVTFADENGEPMRYERTTSLNSVYHERFKVVLEGNITIAGRPYEVSTPIGPHSNRYDKESSCTKANVCRGSFAPILMTALESDDANISHSSWDFLIRLYEHRPAGSWHRSSGKASYVTPELSSKT